MSKQAKTLVIGQIRLRADRVVSGGHSARRSQTQKKPMVVVSRNLMEALPGLLFWMLNIHMASREKQHQIVRQKSRALLNVEKTLHV